jgi:hypothetical protein
MRQRHICCCLSIPLFCACRHLWESVMVGGLVIGAGCSQQRQHICCHLIAADMFSCIVSGGQFGVLPVVYIISDLIRKLFTYFFLRQHRISDGWQHCCRCGVVAVRPVWWLVTSEVRTPHSSFGRYHTTPQPHYQRHGYGFSMGPNLATHTCTCSKTCQKPPRLPLPMMCTSCYRTASR